MANFQIPYTNPAEYQYDTSKIEVSGGLAKLKLQNSLQSFVEDFADDTDFVYDSDLAEFVGGKLQQKWQNDDYVARAKWYGGQKNLLWGKGDAINCDLSGNASVHADYIDLSQGGYITGDAETNDFSDGEGAVGIEWIPNYNGSPSSRQYIYWESRANGERHNGFGLYQDTNGWLYFEAFDNSGNYIGQGAIQSLIAVSGQSYKFQINWNSFSTYIYMQVGAGSFSKIKTMFGISARGSDIGIFRVGRDHVNAYTPNFYTRNFYRKNTIITTGSTTSIPILNTYAYFLNTAILPEMEHTLPGDLTTFDSFVTVESGTPRYTIQIGRSGDYLYWNGSAWVVSDGSYAQANDESTFNAHVDELDVEGETYGQFKIHFDSSNTQSYVDTLTANLYMDTGYPTDKPSIYKTAGDGVADIEEWISFVETLGNNNEGSVVYQLSDDGVTWLYWDGSIWNTAGASNYNSATVLNTHMLDFDALADKIYVKAIFISDGEQQVELDLNEVGYVINTAPSVYAGTNKVVVYNVATNPFSDCLFSDAEGNIVKAEWKEEDGVYAEISQGVYSTLLEAVQAFEYTPTHSGNKTLYLKITDSYDAYTEDNLIVNVNRIVVPITIKDENGHDLPNVNFNPGDGSGSSLKSSPFNHTYYIGSWTATEVKNRFKILSEAVTVSISTTGLDFEMEKSQLDYEINITLPVLIAKGDSASIDCQINADITGFKVRCEIYDNDGNSLKLANSDSGGSDSQIEMINPAIGEFTIYITKDTTDNFNTKSYMEIEIEDTDGKPSTLYKDKFIFTEEELTWTAP